MQRHTLLFFILFSFLLTSCSHIYGDKGVISNRGTDYLKAKSIPPLKIPPGLSSSTIHAEYSVSSESYPEGTQPISLIPPEL